MKRTFRLIMLLLPFTLGWGENMQAQMQQPAKASHVDSLLLDERIEGEYRLRRYRVEQSEEADFSVRYRINLSTLNPQFGNNSSELQAIEQFFSTVTADSPRTVKLISITGYASPDGPMAFNERLSKARTADFLRYGDKNYHFSERFKLDTRSVAEDWEGLRQWVMQSSMADRAAVLKILDSGLTHEEKERQLKAMPATWEYLKSEILPQLRRVDVVVNYAQQSIVEQRLRVAPPKPAPVDISRQSPCGPCDCDVVEEGITGLIVEYPEELLSHSRSTSHRAHRARR